ncbi:hypothetical protein [Devosia sp. 2618]|uniref:hypothetical protein n=1 Tax=Devosia sp. 2618 TaxID=3156454 RepID=UPI0033936FB9
MQQTAPAPAPTFVSPPDIGIDHNGAFGAFVEKNQQFSQDLLIQIKDINDSAATLVSSYGQTLTDLGQLRIEHSRVNSLLEDEASARRKFEGMAGTLSAENRDIYAQLVQHRSDLDSRTSDLAQMRTLYETEAERYQAADSRLRTLETEVTEQTAQLELSQADLTQTQEELDARGAELLTMREALDQERDARAIDIETSGKQIDALARENAALVSSNTQLRSEVEENRTLVANLTAAIETLKLDAAEQAPRHRKTREELDTLRSSSTLEISQLSTRLEALTSKAALLEKLLETAHSRSTAVEEELQASRNETRRAKTDVTNATARAGRLNDALEKLRATATQSETARRALALQLDDVVTKLNNGANTQTALERDLDVLTREQGVRTEADQREIDFLRSNLEIARADIRQLKTEGAQLKGQLEVARSDKGRLSSASAQAEATKAGRPLSVVAISSKASAKAEATEPRAEG